MLKWVAWAETREWASDSSMYKNQWVRITRRKKTVYAQWEDTGPFHSDDADYVFGDDEPLAADDGTAGIDVSPAVRDYLGLSGMDKVNWQFVDGKTVPDGPWKRVITTSQIDWK